MKNKTKYIIMFVILAFIISLCFTIYSFANNIDKNKSSSILTKEKVSNLGNTYEKITTNDNFNKDFIMQKVNNYKTLIDSTSSSKKISNYAINENAYTINDMLTKDYTYTELEQYDNEIWTIRFNKYYNNLINQGEAVKISFSPESREIVSIVIIDNPFENNSIEISQEDAFKIAKKYMGKTSSTDMKVEIKIIRPNYFWYKDLATYKNIQKSRLAYVFTCNDEANVEIYVDCTTGEVIGGNMIVGGEM